MIAQRINRLLTRPVFEKDKRIKIVEIINPEFLITLWKSSVIKKENNKISTSAKIKTVKKSSKKILLILLKESNPTVPGLKLLTSQVVSEYIAKTRNMGTKKVAISFLTLINLPIDACSDGINLGSVKVFLLWM